MARLESRRNILQQVGKVAMQVPAEKLIDVKTLAVEICIQRDAFLARGLQKSVDKERTAGKLLDQQVTRGFAGHDLLPLSHVFDEQRSIVCVETLEPEQIEQLEIA